MILVKERNGRSRSNLRLLDNHLSRLSPARFSSSQFPPDLPIHARSLAQLRKVSADSWRILGSPCGAVSETASHPPCSLSGVQDPSSPVVSLAWSPDVDSRLLELALRQARIPDPRTILRQLLRQEKDQLYQDVLDNLG